MGSEMPLAIKSRDELANLSTQAHVGELIEEFMLYTTANWDRDSAIARSDLRDRLIEHLEAAGKRGKEECLENMQDPDLHTYRIGKEYR
jgi:hypothetical protein